MPRAERRTKKRNDQKRMEAEQLASVTPCLGASIRQGQAALRFDRLNLSLKMGPLGAVLREHPELTVVVADAVRDMLSAHLTPSGVVMPAATWIVTGQSGSAGV